jgi:hypothetical protein
VAILAHEISKLQVVCSDIVGIRHLAGKGSATTSINHASKCSRFFDTVVLS